MGTTGQPAAFPWPCLAEQTFLAETSPCSLTLPSRPLFLLSTCCIGCHSLLLVAGMFWLSRQQPHLPGEPSGDCGAPGARESSLA